jgi:carbonic anhydrase/acetyltransferase-like protein (isoleucine patch superfamily)
MILTHRGERPVIPESAYGAPSAVLCGGVTLGERARVLHGAVLTAEDGEIWIGDDVLIMENALVCGRARHPVSAANAVLIGPHTHVNGATIEEEVFIATAASLFPSSVAGRRSERINSVLHVTPSSLLRRSSPSVRSPLVIQPSSSHRASMINCGRSSPSSTFPKPCTACRAAPLCVRSRADRSSSTVRIKTIRSSIDNSESTAADQQHSPTFE